jgi:hypothetical protein
MNNRTRILSSIAVAAVLLSAGPASAQEQQGTPVYNSTYYSDATQQTAVGYMKWSGCYGDNPQFELEGSYSQYESSYFIGYCQGGQMVLGPPPPG